MAGLIKRGLIMSTTAVEWRVREGKSKEMTVRGRLMDKRNGPGGNGMNGAAAVEDYRPVRQTMQINVSG